jgi:hypothetical protein
MRQRSKQARRWLSTLPVLAVLAGALSGSGQAASASASTATGAGAGTATGAVASACPGRGHGWTAAPPPSPGTGSNSLADVAVLPGCEAWAVGTAVSHGVTRTLTEHWDGSGWTVVPSPDPGRDSFLTGVRAVSRTSVWAVGYFTSGSKHRTLILHWTGTRWDPVPSPSPGRDSELFGVRVVSAHDVWAVGFSASRSGDRTLILRWNGTRWTRLASPSPGRPGGDDDLFSVTATSPRDAWAVGYIFRLSRIRTLILHWNGRHWAHVASPSPGKDAELFGVDATSRSNAWAVGPATPSKTFMLHWDGRRWQRVATPNQGGAGNTLEAVAATSARNAWAVGFYFFRGAEHHTLVLHWNGTRWVHQRTPVQGDSSSLFGVGASSAGSVWAVGRFNTGGPSRSAALHCCSPASQARAAPSSAARAAPRPVLYNLGGGTTASWNLPQRRPKIFFLAADGSAALGNKPHHLKWSRWTRKSATATGRYFFRNGPCCTYHSRSVRITADHVRRNAHRSWYDRMTIRFSKTRSVVLQYKRTGGNGFWDTVSGQFP